MLTIYATDFIYDENRLSDYGFVICSFSEGGGANTAGKGSEINFQTAPIELGKRVIVTGTKYNNTLSAGFDICKNPDLYDGLEMQISNEEFRELSRWLNRRRFLWFHAFDDCEPGVILPWFRASFTLSKIEICGAPVGVHLDMTTDSPFGYGEEIITTLRFENGGLTRLIEDENDEIGISYPDVSIICKEAGDLILGNFTTDCIFRVDNCAVGEKIEQLGQQKIIRGKMAVENLLETDNGGDYNIGAEASFNSVIYSVDQYGVITLRT